MCRIKGGWPGHSVVTIFVRSQEVALLPYNSHRSNVLRKLRCHSQLFSGGFFMASKLIADSTKTVTFHFVYSGLATPLLYCNSAPANFSLINNAYSFNNEWFIEMIVNKQLAAQNYLACHVPTGACSETILEHYTGVRPTKDSFPPKWIPCVILTPIKHTLLHMCTWDNNEFKIIMLPIAIIMIV